MWPFKKTESQADKIVKVLDAAGSEEKALASALNLIFKYTNALSVDPPDIEVRDERELPATKALMIEAFRLVLMVETRVEWRNAFYNAGLKLAYFWPGIGADRLKLPDGLFQRAMAIEQTEEDRFERFRQSESEIQAFSAAFAKVGPERDRIADIFDAAVATIQNVLEIDDDDFEIDTSP